MANRDRSGRVNPLAQNGGANSNLFDLDAKVYGEIRAADSSMQVVESIPLDDISPDPGQPRRVVPAVVRAMTNGESIVFDTWAVMAFRETSGVEGTAAQAHELYRAIIEGRLEDEGWETPEKPGYIEAALLAVAELAANIRQVGLTNPITVAPAPEGLVDTKYIIETGERRYWAYRLLNFYYGPDWLKIPAKVQPALDIWKQAAENNQRSDLNAIQKARQLAILLMDLLQTEEYEKAKKEDRAAVKLFAPMTGFAREQDYYAQVADANKWRVPYGKMEQLLPAMGLKNRNFLSEYRGLLKLPPKVWIEADDRNYSRDLLLQIVRAANNLDEERVDYGNKPLISQHPLPQGEGDQTRDNISQIPPALPQKSPSPAISTHPPEAGQGGNIPSGISQARPGESVIGVGKWVYVKDGRIGIVTRRISGSIVEVEVDGRFGPYPPDSLKPAPMQIGMAVKTRNGHTGWITGGIGTNMVEVKYNGVINTHKPETLKPVNRAQEKIADAPRGSIRLFELSDYPLSSDLPSWIERYKALRRLYMRGDDLLFIKSGYGHFALREDAKAAHGYIKSGSAKVHMGNTEHGWALFALDYSVIDEIARHRHVAIYQDSDETDVDMFWVNHVLRKKQSPDPSTFVLEREDGGGDAQADAVIMDVAPDAAMEAFAELVGGEFTEDHLETVRQFWIQKCHEFGILTPWDSETAITSWLAEDLVENGEMADGLTLERLTAAQSVLGQARAWMERR